MRSLFLAEAMDPAPVLDEIEDLARRRRVRVQYVSRGRIDAMARTDGPQGVVALAEPLRAVELASLCVTSADGSAPFLLVLDRITDPQNLGGLLRSAECAGVSGVILPRHRAAHVTPTVAKVAAGAIEYVPMALVAGIPTALRQLTEQGIWTVGLAAEAQRSFYDLDAGEGPVALVLGAEGTGLSDLVRKRCDVLAALPQRGVLGSLNVTAAGTVACFEIARHRG